VVVVVGSGGGQWWAVVAAVEMGGGGKMCTYGNARSTMGGGVRSSHSWPLLRLLQSGQHRDISVRLLCDIVQSRYLRQYLASQRPFGNSERRLRTVTNFPVHHGRGRERERGRSSTHDHHPALGMESSANIAKAFRFCFWRPQQLLPWIIHGRFSTPSRRYFSVRHGSPWEVIVRTTHVHMICMYVCTVVTGGALAQKICSVPCAASHTPTPVCTTRRNCLNPPPSRSCRVCVRM